MFDYKQFIENFRNFNFKDLDNNSEKWAISIFLGILFIIFSSKFFYLYLNIFTRSMGKDIITNIGCVKSSGIFISSVIFTIVLYVIFTIASEGYESNDNRLVISLLVGTLFFFLNLNVVYIQIENLKNKMFFKKDNKLVSCEKTVFSKVVTALLFVLILRLLLN